MILVTFLINCLLNAVVIAMMSASQVLTEIETYQLDADNPVIPQVEMMGASCRKLLNDCGVVVDEALQAAFREVGDSVQSLI